MFEDCSFDGWEHTALEYIRTPMVVIRRSTFAMGGGPPPAGEAINGKYGGCLIEHSTFGKVSGRADVIDLEHQYWNVTSTIIRYNYFLGGNDDGIDLDSADGWIYGNLLQDFWPSCDVSLCAIGSYCCGGGNGGGITGGTRGVDAGRTRPVIANNIIRRCYHGVGFKDGAHPLVVNNLILDCFVGITLYSERNDNPGAATTAGNIIWHDGHFGPAARSVVLGSTWWQAICKRRALQWGGQRGELQGSMCCSRRDFPAAGAMCGSQRRTQIRRARPTTGVAVGGLRHFAVTTSLL